MRRDLLWVTLLFTALTVVMAYPLSVTFATHTLPPNPDHSLFLWTLGWDVHAFTQQPLSIFDANIYFPYDHTLAYSENLLGSALVAAPIIWLTGNLGLALNVVSLLSVVLCGVGTYLLARRLNLGVAAAIVAGLIFAFSPPRFFRLGQLHLTVIQWIPFALAYLHRYFDTGRRRDLRIALAFFTIQALSTGHGATFLLLAAICITLDRAVRDRRLAIRDRLRDVGWVGLLILVPVALIAIPYLAVQGEIGLRRTLDDWGIVPQSFVASPSHAWSFVLSVLPGGDQVNVTADAFLFPGVLPIVFALVGLVDRRRTVVRPYLILTIVGIWLSIGPPLGLWQFVFWLPGLNFIREASRFSLLAMLGLSILAAVGFERLIARWPAMVGRRLAVAVGAFLLIEFAAFPLAVADYQGELPAVDRWLATQPAPFVVAELPLPNPRQAGPFERRQTAFMLHSTAHWQKTVHGYSGIRPALHAELYPAMRGFPDNVSLSKLVALGVDYVVVHTELYDPGVWSVIEAQYAAHAGAVELVHTDGPGRVYRLRRKEP